MNTFKTSLASVVIALASLAAGGAAHAAIIPNGSGLNGSGLNGWGTNGWGQNGWGQNGWGQNGWGQNGIKLNGLTKNGVKLNGEQGTPSLPAEAPPPPPQSVTLPDGRFVPLF